MLQHGRDRKRRGDGLDHDHRTDRWQILSPGLHLLGDNRPNDGMGTYPSFPRYYDLFLTLDGGAAITYAGVDQFPGLSAPHDVDLIFTATGPTESLAFSQFSSGSSQQSPILGGLAVSTPEPSTWVMLGLGFAALGYARVRRARGSVVCRAA
jgi:hypothetical protein